MAGSGMKLGSTDLHQLVRFGFAGGLNTCFGYVAFASFLWLTGLKELAVIFGTIAGVLFNFNTYKMVFAGRGFSRLPHFVSFYVAVLCLNILLLRLMTTAGVSPYLGQAVIVSLIAPLSFLTLRFWVFPDVLETPS